MKKLTWNVEKYLHLLKRSKHDRAVFTNHEFLFYTNCIDCVADYKQRKFYLTVINSFLDGTISAPEFCQQFSALRNETMLLANELEELLKCSLTSEEKNVDIIHWEDEFEILGQRVDWIFDWIHDDTYLLILENSELANKLESGEFLKMLVKETVFIFEKLS